MPHVDELHANLQAILKKDIIKAWYTEIILDPSGYNIDLTDYIDTDSNIIINKKKSIYPYGRLGAFSIGEVKIKCVNTGDFFNRNSKGSTFYFASSRLYTSCVWNQSYIDVPKGDGDKFDHANVTTIVIRDGSNYSERTISSVDTTSYSYYDRINLTGNVLTGYDAGAMVETRYLPGKEITVKTCWTGESEKITQFVGVLKEHPRLTADGAEITLYDNFSKLLDIDLKANSYKILTDSLGNYTNTLEIKREEDPASGGLLDMNEITINDSHCKIGDWTLEFTSDSQDYKVTDPDGIEYTGGDVSSNFYIGSSPTHQLLINSSAWDGTDYDKGDLFEFKTTCALGAGANSYTDIPEILYRILIEDFGADLSTGDLDTTSWTTIRHEFESCHGAITFTKKISVLKAIELLQAHINACVFHNNDGEFAISSYRPQQEPGTVYTLSPDADIMTMDITDEGRIQRIKAKYAFAHDEGDYASQILLPPGADQIGAFLNLNFPAYHTSDRAPGRSSTARIYRMWSRGVNQYSIKEKWGTGIAFDLNEQYKISSDHPVLGEKLTEIFQLSKNISNGDIKINVYDKDFTFGNYAFTDVDYTDRGKVTW
jgi:hypothetical protein